MATRTREMRKMKCMNHDPETSKWGEYAPPGGCDEVVMVDQRTTKVLCWRCTLRSTQGPMHYFEKDED